MIKSAIYEGSVRHRRFIPRPNMFQYRLFFMFLDLKELPTLFDIHPLWSYQRWNVAFFRRKDHFGDPSVPLDTAVRDLIQTNLGNRPVGPIRMLTHLRYFGYCFNPASFYYCYDDSDIRVETIVVEIHNTPWGERHCYLVPLSAGQPVFGAVASHAPSEALRKFFRGDLIGASAVVEVLLASLIVAFTTGLFFLLAREFVSRTGAAVLAGVLAFCTPAWSTSQPTAPRVMSTM